jgi:hypothetical protein
MRKGFAFSGAIAVCWFTAHLVFATVIGLPLIDLSVPVPGETAYAEKTVNDPELTLYPEAKKVQYIGALGGYRMINGERVREKHYSNESVNHWLNVEAGSAASAKLSMTIMKRLGPAAMDMSYGTSGYNQKELTVRTYTDYQRIAGMRLKTSTPKWLVKLAAPDRIKTTVHFGSFTQSQTVPVEVH